MLRWPQKFSDRDHRLDSITLDQSPEKVLNAVGVPDRVNWFHDGEPSYGRAERWSYFRGVDEETGELVITWQRSGDDVSIKTISNFENPSVFDDSFLTFQC